MVKNPPFNAGDTGLIPGRGTKIPHAAEQISPRATTTELVHLNERAHVPQPTEPMHPGACVPQLERENPLSQLERGLCTTMKSPRAATKDSACLNKDPVCCN